jgi:hypothetical protein
MLILLALACARPTDDSDTGGVDTDATEDTDVEISGPALDCVDLGLPIRPFEDADDDPTLYAVAGDVTIDTLDGEWDLRENWSGCDSYLFIPEVPQQLSTSTPLWGSARDTEELLKALPDNVHVFFLPSSRDEGERVAAVEALQADVDDILADWSGADREWLSARLHFVTERDSEVFGWLGDSLGRPGWGAGIDRFQRVRYIGSFADPRRFKSDIGWFADNLAMAANEPTYWNFEFERQQRLDAEDALVVPVFEGEVVETGWSGPPGTKTIEISADAIKSYDTLELDHTLNCVGAGEYTECPAWDYLNYLRLCTDVDAEGCSCGDAPCPEIGRYITTYHREGRWVHDISPLLPLLRDGGRKKFAYYSIQPYETYLSLRFSSSRKPEVPAAVQPLFYGGNFSPTYNDRAPVEVVVPADVKKVELATVISGHGMQEPNNCAEFCKTDHHFWVNGTEFVRSIEEPGDNFGCMSQIPDGTVPNQFGTWWYGRNGWCPGKQVDMVNLDVTSAIRLGEPNTFEYKGFQEGRDYTGSATIDMVTWLSFSR